MTIDETSLTRQCDKDYLATLQDRIDSYDAVVSLACGAGVQFLVEMYKTQWIFPGVNTKFIGVTEERGVWAERCQACGVCILASTGGICPVSRCFKRMLNGPCGWQLIYERLKELGQLDRSERPVDPKDWSPSRDGGPRKIIEEVSRL